MNCGTCSEPLSHLSACMHLACSACKGQCRTCGTAVQLLEDSELSADYVKRVKLLHQQLRYFSATIQVVAKLPADQRPAVNQRQAVPVNQRPPERSVKLSDPSSIESVLQVRPVFEPRRSPSRPVAAEPVAKLQPVAEPVAELQPAALLQPVSSDEFDMELFLLANNAQKVASARLSKAKEALKSFSQQLLAHSISFSYDFFGCPVNGFPRLDGAIEASYVLEIENFELDVELYTDFIAGIQVPGFTPTSPGEWCLKFGAEDERVCLVPKCQLKVVLSQVLQLLSSIDSDRVRTLGTALTFWSSKRKLFLPDTVTLLLYISYLQHCDPIPVLPRLDYIEKHDGSTTVQGVDCSFETDVSKYQEMAQYNELSRDELLLGFCQYYLGFPWQYNFVSMRECDLKATKEWDSPMAVEDPLQTDINLTSVLPT